MCFEILIRKKNFRPLKLRGLSPTILISFTFEIESFLINFHKGSLPPLNPCCSAFVVFLKTFYFKIISNLTVTRIIKRTIYSSPRFTSCQHLANILPHLLYLSFPLSPHLSLYAHKFILFFSESSESKLQMMPLSSKSFSVCFLRTKTYSYITIV